MLDETPRLVGTSLGARLDAPAAHGPSAGFGSELPPLSLASAEAFVTSAYASQRAPSPEVGGPPLGLATIAELQVASLPDAAMPRIYRSLEDEVDSLRASMPDRSTHSLRTMVRQKYGDEWTRELS